MDPLTIYGVAALSFMMLMCWLKHRGPVLAVGFALRLHPLEHLRVPRRNLAGRGDRGALGRDRTPTLSRSEVCAGGQWLAGALKHEEMDARRPALRLSDAGFPTAAAAAASGASPLVYRV